MRYIDADKLINELEPVVKSAAFKNRNIMSNVNKCWEIVNNQPTADVRENVRGEWIDKPNREFCFRADFKSIECNQCGYNMPKSDSFASNYCPNCGAQMIRGEQDG